LSPGDLFRDESIKPTAALFIRLEGLNRIRRFDEGVGTGVLAETCLNLGTSDDVLLVTDKNFIDQAGFLATVAVESGSEVAMTMMNLHYTLGVEFPSWWRAPCYLS
jgi:hypothetical protein